jgi:hypothetical protein
MGLSAVGLLTSGSLGSATPASHVVHPTSADKAALESTFVKYKLASHGMKRTDHIKWTLVRATDPVGPLMAYDAVDHRYWALANFNLLLPASYAAKVSFQDGGSYGVFLRTTTGHWLMKGHAGIPLCPSIVPSPTCGPSPTTRPAGAESRVLPIRFAGSWPLDQRSAGRRSAKLLAPHHLQTRPVLVERGNLHVHQSERQDHAAHLVVGDVTRVAAGPSRPRHPQRTVGLDRFGERRDLSLQGVALVKEGDEDVSVAGSAPQDPHVRGQFADGPAGRRVHQHEAVALLQSELRSERGGRVAGGHSGECRLPSFERASLDSGSRRRPIGGRNGRGITCITGQTVVFIRNPRPGGANGRI